MSPIMHVCKKCFEYLFRFICFCLASLIPKRKSIWVFGAWFGQSFSDNPKYLYQYIYALKHKSIKPIWVTKNSEVVSELTAKGMNVYYYKSFKGIYYQLVSKVVFVGHSVSSDLNPYCIGLNTKRVQLWHGIPFKKIGFDDTIHTNKSLLAKKLSKVISFFNNNRYNIVTSTGEFCSNHFSSAFGIPLERIINTGFPRNDVFNRSAIDREKSGIFKVIYMPTFRGDIGDEFDLFAKFGFDTEKLEMIFDSANVELHIRTHPANKPSDFLMSKLKKSNRIFLSTISDIYEEINCYDCLITDYSSIMFDFALTSKPILFAPFDLDCYLSEDRELYYSYEEVSGGVSYHNWEELAKGIIKAKEMIDTQPPLFLQSFHNNISSCEDEYSKCVFEYVKSSL
ncbi:CDP-glycerol glycerophosphotransferase family protein [Shewanella sp. 10N.286.51.B8]|uniref:CDP-glycerol glycerophosphotransferase family protein n=1 Tax=Shewanella sp. 10N.286.51.B8 TaxID=3229708 RepID=UPI00354BEB87